MREDQSRRRLGGNVKQDYLDRKNRHLTNNDHEHPSFIRYIETINDIYNWLVQEANN